MAKPHRVFITGVSSGLGLALCKKYLEQGSDVYGLSRKEVPELTSSILSKNFHHISCDLESEESIVKSLSQTKLPDLFNLVILNAGQVGQIRTLIDSNLKEMQRLMQVHLWANQTIMQSLIKSDILVKQVIGISSGAAVNGNQGWSGYSLSKAAFNMWISLFSQDFPETHFTALAPGLIDTKMQDYLCDEVNAKIFKSLQRIKGLRGTIKMPTPEELAPRFVELVPQLLNFKSGSFQDIRMI